MPASSPRRLGLGRARTPKLYAPHILYSPRILQLLPDPFLIPLLGLRPLNRVKGGKEQRQTPARINPTHRPLLFRGFSRAQTSAPHVSGSLEVPNTKTRGLRVILSLQHRDLGSPAAQGSSLHSSLPLFPAKVKRRLHKGAPIKRELMT